MEILNLLPPQNSLQTRALPKAAGETEPGLDMWGSCISSVQAQLFSCSSEHEGLRSQLYKLLFVSSPSIYPG